MLLFLSESLPRGPVQVVERKGLGHPDTICDALAESVSVALSRHYLERFGTILHHNVDKALLRAGTARPVFGGGDLTEPIEIYLAGRAATEVRGEHIPVAQIATESARQWLRENLLALDPDRHVRFHCLVRPGSADLTQLFERGETVPLANDTSFGVAHAPLDDLEQFALSVENRLNDRDYRAAHPAGGEDVKVMVVREPGSTHVTVARAFVSRFVPNLEAYLAEKEATALLVKEVGRDHGFDMTVRLNAADDPARGSVYLTVTGTSAEAGDDGEVGRGNRANGLITPARPMSLEAVTGKNPITHVGKLYNVAAREMAQAIVAECADLRRAVCLLVSEIGRPITEPMTAQVELETTDDRPVHAYEPMVREIVSTHLQRLPMLWQRIVAGEVQLF